MLANDIIISAEPYFHGPSHVGLTVLTISYFEQTSFATR